VTGIWEAEAAKSSINRLFIDGINYGDIDALQAEPQTMEQLISYIGPSAPATRRPATGKKPHMRLEVGFTPRWFRSKLGLDFGLVWHTNPEYRKSAVLAMRTELKQRFPGHPIGENSGKPDLLTGTFGACAIAGIYGLPIIYSSDNWPNSAHQPISDSAVDSLAPPDLDKNVFFQGLLKQLNWIAEDQGEITGFINWQGILNNAQRIRGPQIFTDMFINHDMVHHLMDCICTTMIDGARRLYKLHRESGVEYRFFTVSNCLVNMISPDQYQEFILPLDQRISHAFETIGIHNCAWNADPYMEHYAGITNLGYIDMGMDSNLTKAKRLFPEARRAIMYTPMDFNSRPMEQVIADMEWIQKTYGPCDIVLADLDEGTSDEKVSQLFKILNTF